MKKALKTSAILLAFLLCIILIFSGCDKIFSINGDEHLTEELTAPDYSNLNLNEYIKLGDYKGLHIALGNIEEDMTASVALWSSIVDKAEVIKYPEEALSYYEEQTTRLYMSYAQKGNMSYDELMSALGKTSENIETEAKEYVKSDLVKFAIIKAEGLSLTDDEKTRLFDKYAKQFATTYGYTEEYAKENLANEIYDAMQHDKMIEFLLLNNEVIENYVEEE